MHSYQNNPEKSYTEKKTMHEASGYSMFPYRSFDSTKVKLDCLHRQRLYQKFCEDLREHAMKIINYEKRK